MPALREQVGKISRPAFLQLGALTTLYHTGAVHLAVEAAEWRLVPRDRPDNDGVAEDVNFLIVRPRQDHLRSHVTKTTRVASHLVGISFTTALLNASAEAEIEQLEGSITSEAKILRLQI